MRMTTRLRAFISAAALLAVVLPARAGFRNTYEIQVSSDYSVLELDEATDGGYAAAGGRPMFLVKVDASGALQFAMTYDADEATSIDATSDGGFLLAGEKLNYDDYLIVKTDAAGVVQSSQAYSQGGGEQGLYSARRTSDGGAIASGIWTLKLDAAGNVQWNVLHVGGGGNVNSVRQTADDGFLAVGEGSYGMPADDYNLVVTRIDSGGARVWNKVFGGNGYDWGASGEEVAGGGAIVAGWTTSFGAGGSDGYLVLLDASGAVTWAFTYGTAGDDAFQSVRPAVGGGFIASGRLDGQPALVKIDAAGSIEWAQAYPTTAVSGNGTLYSVHSVSDGSFVAAGKDEFSRLLLVKVDAAGSTGGCPQLDPGISAAPAPFLTADNSPFFSTTYTSPAQTTTGTPATPVAHECIPVTNAPPSCSAGGDVLVACDGVTPAATASDSDGDVLTYSWTSSCAGTTFAPGADVLNPLVTLGLGCTATCDLTLFVSDGNGGTCSDTIRVDVDCTSDPAADCDGDGATNGVDCAPLDPSAFAVPGEVPLLRVAKSLAGDAELDWADVAASAGTGTRYDVVGGQISALWLDRSFAGAGCVARDVAAITASDARPMPSHAPGFTGDGWYYLVRAQDACGSSTYGSGAAGPRAIDPALCD